MMAGGWRAGAVARLERAGISGRFGGLFQVTAQLVSFQIALRNRLALGGQPEQLSSQLRFLPHPHWHGSCWANIIACVPYSSIKRSNERPNTKAFICGPLTKPGLIGYPPLPCPLTPSGCSFYERRNHAERRFGRKSLSDNDQ
jgi:hypothetical protein